MNVNSIKQNNPLNVPTDTKNSVKQMASESWEEVLAGFYDFVEDRIKNGPPKIQTGSGAWSVDEWKELIDKIDKDIDTVKKEQKERIEKKNEEAEEKQRLEEAGCFQYCNNLYIRRI